MSIGLPSIAYANSADAPYIPSSKERGFTALDDKFLDSSIIAYWNIGREKRQRKRTDFFDDPSFKDFE